MGLPLDAGNAHFGSLRRCCDGLPFCIGHQEHHGRLTSSFSACRPFDQKSRSFLGQCWSRTSLSGVAVRRPCRQTHCPWRKVEESNLRDPTRAGLCFPSRPLNHSSNLPYPWLDSNQQPTDLESVASTKFGPQGHFRFIPIVFRFIPICGTEQVVIPARGFEPRTSSS